jgi:hypothetical protein
VVALASVGRGAAAPGLGLAVGKNVGVGTTHRSGSRVLVTVADGGGDEDGFD